MTGDNWGMFLPHKRHSLEEETFLVSEEFVSNMQLLRCSDVYFTLVLRRSLTSELLENQF